MPRNAIPKAVARKRFKTCRKIAFTELGKPRFAGTCPITGAIFRHTFSSIAVAALILALAPPATAQYDPSLHWQTLETPHFLVHYHDGEAELAQRVARAAEAAHARLTPLLDHAPARRTEIALSDDTDDANGVTTAFLYPSIHLFAAPPGDEDELNDYDDYVWQLVVHEYTHVLHMDNVRGVPAALDRVFGQLDIPNAVQPAWVLEGLAVFEESSLSQSGRNRSSLFDMYLRAGYLAGGLLRLDEISNDPTRFPRGSTPYLYGGHFLQYLADRAGPKSLAVMSDDYGERLVPFAVNLTARQAFGAGFDAAYPGWLAALARRYEAQLHAIRSQPVTAARALTHLGDFTGEPRFSPDGRRIYYLEQSADRRPQLRFVTPDGRLDQRIAEVLGGGSFAVAPGGAFLVASEPQVWRQFYLFDDLYRVDVASGRTTRLTRGLRAREPDISADGRQIACAVNLGAGQMGLAVVPIEGGRATTVYRADVGDQVYTPRFSPDGRALVFSSHRGRFRDLRLLDLETGAVRDLTRDQAIDLDPTFDRSGRWILFSSDRTGVYDIYALEVASGEVRQVTHVETGAFHPDLSPDGHTLAFTSFSSRGFDVSATEVSLDALPEAPPSRADRGPSPYESTREVYAAHAYHPLPTLLPKYWLPVVASDAAGTVLGALTSGSDILGKHSYALEAYYSLGAGEVDGSAQYANRSFYPVLAASAERAIHFIPGGPSGSVERQSAIDGSVTVPFNWIDHALSLGAGYELRAFTPLSAPALHPDAAHPFLPDRGAASTLSLTLTYSSARGFANAISSEEGWTGSVTARAARRALGGTFEYDEVDGAVARYLRMPWAMHQVLALHAAGGYGSGDLARRRLFTLGGPVLSDPVLSLIRGDYGNADALRGYKPGAFSGNAFALGTVEYRFPLADLDRGLWTLPFYLRRLHGAAFADVGEAADRPTFALLHPSIGAEARLEVTLGYYLTTDVRLGYARGLGADGIHDVYLMLGGAF